MRTEHLSAWEQDEYLMGQQTPAAVQHLGRAIEAAEHDDALRFAARAADLAANRLSDPGLATSIYERLLERDRHDREVWIPLLDLHRRALIGVAVVAADAGHVTDVLEQCERLVSSRPELQVLSARTRWLGPHDD